MNRTFPCRALDEEMAAGKWLAEAQAVLICCGALANEPLVACGQYFRGVLGRGLSPVELLTRFKFVLGLGLSRAELPHRLLL